jgi:hypothetical protein
MACGEFFVCRTKITAIEVHEHGSNTGIGAVVTDFNQSNKVKLVMHLIRRKQIRDAGWRYIWISFRRLQRRIQFLAVVYFCVISNLNTKARLSSDILTCGWNFTRKYVDTCVDAHVVFPTSVMSHVKIFVCTWSWMRTWNWSAMLPDQPRGNRFWPSPPWETDNDQAVHQHADCVVRLVMQVVTATVHIWMCSPFTVLHFSFHHVILLCNPCLYVARRSSVSRLLAVRTRSYFNTLEDREKISYVPCRFLSPRAHRLSLSDYMSDADSSCLSHNNCVILQTLFCYATQSSVDHRGLYFIDSDAILAFTIVCN